MPDIQMCRGQDCEVADNCYRCPLSGTVAHTHQVWGPIPGHDHTCRSYSPVWQNDMPTLEQRLMRVVEYFCAHLGAKESTRNNFTAAEMKAYIAASFFETIAWNENNNPQLGDEIVAWLKDCIVDSDDVFAVIENNILGVICLMDTHDGGTRYIDQVVQHFDKPKPALTVVRGNGTVN
jgi:hypothetical protein